MPGAIRRQPYAGARMTVATMRKPRAPAAAKIQDPKCKDSKAKIESAAEAEITLGEFVFKPTPEVKQHPRALQKWREITRIYKKAEDQIGTYLSDTDNGILNRYCIATAEWIDMVNRRRELAAFELPPEDSTEAILMCQEEYNTYRAKKLWCLMEYTVSLSALLKLDSAIDRKLKAILDLEDRIFLNPAAKVRTLPIKRHKKRDPADDLGFDV